MPLCEHTTGSMNLCGACAVMAAAERIVEDVQADRIQTEGTHIMSSFPRSPLEVRILTLLASYAPHGLTAATMASSLEVPLQAVVHVTHALHLLGTIHANEKGYYRYHGRTRDGLDT